jgi:hypothetical protein
MKRLVLALVALTAATACHKEETPAAADAGAAPAKTAAAPFTGKLTSARVMGAKGLASPFDKWTDAEPKLEAQLGKATYVKDGKMYMWAVAEGDDCTYVEVEKQKDGTVGVVSDPMKVSKGGPVMNWDECLTAAGVRKEPVDDPNAPGPPEGGKAITVLELKDGASKARSKWNKAKVTVKGLYLNVTNSTVNGTQSATVVLTAAKGDVEHTVSCDLADPKKAPTKLRQYAPIKVTGAVQVQDMISLAGNRSVDVNLESCAIVK